jgi:transposase
MERRRLEAVGLFDRGFNNTEIARRLCVANQTVSRWRKKYALGGPVALTKAPAAGRRQSLRPDQRQRLLQLLRARPEIRWTSRRVADLIESEFGIRYSSGHVWKILHVLKLTQPAADSHRSRE